MIPIPYSKVLSIVACASGVTTPSVGASAWGQSLKSQFYQSWEFKWSGRRFFKLSVLKFKSVRKTCLADSRSIALTFGKRAG